MKGKYGNAAERRRHLEDLTNRAETAERKAEKLKVDFADLRATSERQICDLRAQVAELKRQMEEATSPALDEAHRRINELRELASAKDDVIHGLKSGIDEINTDIVRSLRATGLDEASIRVVKKQIDMQAIMSLYGDSLGRGEMRAEEIKADMARADDELKRLSRGWRK